MESRARNLGCRVRSAHRMAEESGPCALAAPRAELDGAVGNRDPEGCPDGPFDQPDVAAMPAHQLGGDRQAEAGAARARRSVESLEEMHARLVRYAGAGVRDLDDDDRALAPAGHAHLIA